MRRLATVGLVIVVGCTPPLVLRGSPPSGMSPLVHDSVVDLPAVNEARGAMLADGWPVWVVRHGDGSVTVFSAVAARARSGATLFDVDRALVRWQPRTRHLLAGDIAYDELGRPLGYADARELDHPDDVADLDTFAVAPDGDRIAIGAMVPARAAPQMSRWTDWDDAPHVTRELPSDPDERSVAPAVALADAATAPIGSYAVVRGAIVQSTDDSPRVCGCDGCAPSSPRALGVRPVTVSARTSHHEPATMLVRRDPDGLAVIATTVAGACSG
jgi:hypothetical protein